MMKGDFENLTLREHLKETEEKQRAIYLTSFFKWFREWELEYIAKNRNLIENYKRNEIIK